MWNTFSELTMAKQLEGKFCLIPGEKLCREC